MSENTRAAPSGVEHAKLYIFADCGVHVIIRLAEPKLRQGAKAGGARRDRTDDLMLAKHALSQLSYGPVSRERNDR